MRAIVILIGMLFSNAAYAAGYAKPAGAPEVYVPGYNVSVGVWAVPAAIGQGIGVFENNGSGWTLCGQCIFDPAYPTLDADVAAAGGPEAYVASKLPAINALLASRYGGGKPATMLDAVNQALSNYYAIRLVNGSPQLAPK